MKLKKEKRYDFNKIIFILLIIIFLGELFFLIFEFIGKNKRPILINFWVPSYKKISSISVYQNHLLLCDEILNQVKIFEKMTGKEENIIQLDKIPLWAAENSKGEIFIIVNNENKVLKYSDSNKREYIEFDGCKSPILITIDSEDNIYLFDKRSKKIIKYSYDKYFKIVEYQSVNYIPYCILIGGDGNLYARINMKNFIKIICFDLTGNLLKELNFKEIKKPYWWSNLAVDKNSNIYLEFYDKHLFYVYNKKGKNIAIFGEDKDRKRIFKWPSLIGYSNGRIFATDPDIVIFEEL